LRAVAIEEAYRSPGTALNDRSTGGMSLGDLRVPTLCAQLASGSPFARRSCAA
jgi:hypothetical protein